MKKRNLLLLPLFALLLAGCKPGKTSDPVSEQPSVSEGPPSTVVPSVDDEDSLPEIPSSEVETVETISIEAARGSADETVTVQGTITSIYGMASASLGVTIQEGNFALSAVFVSKEAAAVLAVGDHVRVKGKIAVFNGLVQFSSPVFTKLDTAAPVITPFEITEFSDTALAGKDGARVKMDGLKFVKSEALGGNTRYIMKSGEKELPMLLSQYIEPDIQNAIKAKMDGLKSSDTVNFNGILGWYNEPQLNPVVVDAITVVAGQGPVEPVPPTALAFEQGDSVLAPAETLQLVVKPSPSDADLTGLVYASSAPAVATVSQTGLVTAVADGVANITATVGTVVGTIKITVETPNPAQIMRFDFTNPSTWVSDDKEGQNYSYGNTYNVVIKSGDLEMDWKFRGSNPNNLPVEGVRFGSKHDDKTNPKLDQIITSGLPMDAAKAATLSAVFAQSNEPVIGKVKEVTVKIDGLFGKDVTRDKIYLQASANADFTAPINLGEIDGEDGKIKFALDQEYEDHYFRIIFGLVNTDGNAGYKVHEIGFYSEHSEAELPPVLTALAFNEADSTLAPEATLQLTLKPTPVDAPVEGVVYDSDAKAVATVSATGLVTAVAVGEANITATVGEIVATIKITVKETVVDPDPEEGDKIAFSFADTSQRVSLDEASAVFVNGDATVTQLKGDGTSPVADYINPLRIYKNHHVKFELGAGKLITKIVIVANSATYATNIATGDLGGATATITNDVIVTITLSTTASELLFKNTVNQTRFDSLEIYYV